MTARATAHPSHGPTTEAATRPSERRVQGAGVELAVIEMGDPERPTVVLVHGYPDTKEIWVEVMNRLAGAFHVVAYDVRGAGASGAPADPAGFDLDRLADDFEAVLDAVAPNRPVHLVGHDWGSIQGWEFATSPRFEGRLTSFTSISGPSLDHAAHWIRARLRRPTPRAMAALAGQGARSWYIAMLRVPGLAERAWPRLIARRWPRILAQAERVPQGRGYPMPTVGQDGARGAGLYRRNIGLRLRRPRDDAVARVPVQLVVARAERYISPRMYDDLEHWAPVLRRRTVAGGHWVPLTEPALLSGWIAEFAGDVERGAATGAAPVTRPGGAGPFDGRLVLVTGAGSGIGRATAIAFAQAGARLVLVDIDGDAAAHTADAVEAVGSEAHAATADVADPEAMERLATEVAAEHGVVDVLVNNAGIAVSGPFLETSVADWRRLLDVNLWGVIHGCRLFGRQMVERGEGGQIVNVASAAAFQPSKDLAAYGASKAAVLMLSECLRAELSEHGIGVTAICPGLIATNITRVARFVGVDEAEQARMREQATRLYRRRNYTPERVAEHIVRAAARDRAVVAVSPEAKAARLFYGLAPGLLRRIARVNPLSR
jgi:NAD(P)-dependent dehydrogenase (short-subunit alcohol dehydrogenase family)/pimeloyl-ACP methyl ester carboxylesterase